MTAGAQSRAAAIPASLAADDPLEALFGALADSSRRALVLHLARYGPATATSLTAALAGVPGSGVRPMTRQAIVKHLGDLSAAGLVSGTRRGREVFYAADVAPLAQVVGWLLDAGAQWDARIDRLRNPPPQSRL